MALMNPAILSLGKFGVGHFAGQTITCGKALTRLGEEWYLVYGDDGAGTYNPLFPLAAADEGDADVAVIGQDLDATFTDTNVKLLLHGEGLDDGTDIIDSSLSGHAITALNDGKIDTSQKVFGVSSLYGAAGSDAFSVPDHADWDFAGGAFTIDGRMRFEGLPAPVAYLWYQVEAGEDSAVQLWWANDDKLYFRVRSGGVSILTLSSAVLNAAVDTWYHVAVTRSGNVFNLYLNGAIEATDTQAITMPNVPEIALIKFGMEGWMDEFRIVKGEAKWTTTFTPPTTPYGWEDIKTWRYRIHGVSPGGTIGDASEATPVTITASGDMYLAAGNDPTDLTLTLTTAGACILNWRYSEVDQPARPTGFKVYRLIAAVYTLADTVAFMPGVLHYSYTSGEFGDTTALDYTVRTYRTVDGVDYEQETNDNVTGTADASAPAAPTSLTVTT